MLQLYLLNPLSRDLTGRSKYPSPLETLVKEQLTYPLKVCQSAACARAAELWTTTPWDLIKALDAHNIVFNDFDGN